MGRHLVHTWHRGEPNHGLPEILTNGEGDGGLSLESLIQTQRKHLVPHTHSCLCLHVKVHPFLGYSAEIAEGTSPRSCPDTTVQLVFNKLDGFIPPISSLLQFLGIAERFHCSACHEATTVWHSFPSPHRALTGKSTMCLNASNNVLKKPFSVLQK